MRNERQGPPLTAVEEAVSRRLRQARTERGLTLQGLGLKIGKSKTQIHHYENGYSRIDSFDLYNIARALKVPVGYFFGEVEASPFGDDLQMNAAYSRKPAEVRQAIRLLLLGSNALPLEESEEVGA